MNIDGCISEDIHTSGGGEIPPCAGLTSNVLPKAQSSKKAESSLTGVSTNYALSQDPPHWYALRCTYGREKTAYEYMTAKGITAFYPTQTTVKLIKGKRKTVTESLLPNIFFAYGTLAQLKHFVYDNVNLPFLRFYYRHTHVGNRIEKTPMIVPNHQMESLKIIYAAETDNTIVSLAEVPKFKQGQMVRVTDGAFKGVVGRVARWQGQQRVAVVMEELVTVVTAYVPSAFLKKSIRLMEIKKIYTEDLQIAQALIQRDNTVTRKYFYQHCFPLFKSIYDNYYTDCANYKEFIDEIYIVVLAPSKTTGKCQMENFRGESTLASWIKTACLFYCYKKYELKQRMPVCEPLPHSTEKEETEDVISDRNGAESLSNPIDFSGMNSADVETLLGLMSNVRYRNIIRLLYLEQKSHKETAEALGMSMENYYNKRILAEKQFKQVCRKEARHA